jgi:diguanylate cyclase (GGDEF)-like protein
MNHMVIRINEIFSEQAGQVEQLRVQASCDPLTGISHRGHFLASFESHLGREESSAMAQLVLVRVMRLADINRSLGHQRTDRLLNGVARALGETGSQGLPSCFGRLNGTDFAVVYPHANERDDQAVELLARLRQSLADTPGAAVVVSSVGCRPGLGMGELLTKADMGLAEAEAKGDFAYIANGLEPAPMQGGEDQWRKTLQETLLEARVQLMPFPVRDRQGAAVHLECPMRLQLALDGPFEPAARWLPFALRTGMSCDVDMAAVALAVTAIASDGLPRGVNLSPQSLSNPLFLSRLRERLAAAGAAARHLWIEVDEVALERQPDELMELCRQLRPLGVSLGLEHAGDRLSSIGLLLELGLDYVKLSSNWVSGVRHDSARRAWLRSSVAMLHGVGLKVFAEGVRHAEDLPELWACGVDGVTGPAVT